jgi:hypothetical protein
MIKHYYYYYYYYYYSKQSYCPEIRCPPDLPFLCDSGLCTFNYSTCNAANGCPYSAPYRCWNGACADGLSAFQNNCPLNPTPRLCSTPDVPTGVLCNDGSCATSVNNCPGGGVNCEASKAGCNCGSRGQDEIVCLDGSCAPFASSNQVSRCLVTTSPGPNQCTIDRPYRCANGYCAGS